MNPKIFCFFSATLLLSALNLFAAAASRPEPYLVTAKHGTHFYKTPGKLNTDIRKYRRGEILAIIPIGKAEVPGWIYAETSPSKGYLRLADIQRLPFKTDTIDLQTFAGEYRGWNVCGKNRTHLKFAKDGTFTGWLFAGAEEGGCFGWTMKGRWYLHNPQTVCLTQWLKEEGKWQSREASEADACFNVWQGLLIMHPEYGTPLKEIYDTEYLSGLKKAGSP